MEIFCKCKKTKFQFTWLEITEMIATQMSNNNDSVNRKENDFDINISEISLFLVLQLFFFVSPITYIEKSLSRFFTDRIIDTLSASNALNYLRDFRDFFALNQHSKKSRKLIWALSIILITNTHQCNVNPYHVDKKERMNGKDIDMHNMYVSCTISMYILMAINEIELTREKIAEGYGSISEIWRESIISDQTTTKTKRFLFNFRCSG